MEIVLTSQANPKSSSLVTAKRKKASSLSEIKKKAYSESKVKASSESITAASSSSAASSASQSLESSTAASSDTGANSESISMDEHSLTGFLNKYGVSPALYKMKHGGISDDVTVGQRFQISGNDGEDVKDENGTVIGKLVTKKAIVEVTTVQDKFAICEPIAKDFLAGPVAGNYRSPLKVNLNQISGGLSIDDEPINIGDSALLLP